MSVRVSDPATAQIPERELLAQLGLGPNASNDQVEAAHDRILDYLGGAPASLRGWARAQTASVDEAYAVLNGAPPSATASVGASARPPAPVTTAAPDTAPKASGTARTRGALVAEDDFGEYGGELHEPVIRSRRKERLAAVAPVAAAAPVGPGGITITFRRLLAVAGGVGAIAIAAFIYQVGVPSVPGFTGTPGPQASASAIDPTQVTALMQKLQANPNDLTTLRDLGNLYYGGSDFATAATWMEKILAIAPSDQEALLAYGAAKFNLGDLATAETSWRKVVALDSKNAEAHFDLGFVYLSKTPPDTQQARAEWTAAVQIDPTSEVGKQAQSHLDSLLALSSGSPSAAPGSSPIASPAPASPAPSAGRTPAPTPAGS